MNHIGWIIINKSNPETPIYAHGGFSVEDPKKIFPMMKKIIDPLAEAME